MFLRKKDAPSPPPNPLRVAGDIEEPPTQNFEKSVGCSPNFVPPPKNIESPLHATLCLPWYKPFILDKNVSLIAFRQILPKVLPVMWTVRSTIMTYLKNNYDLLRIFSLVK